MSNPDDRPTEQFGRPVEPDQPTEIYHTSDPYQAYGQQPPPNATTAYPTYETYDPNQQPNPTQAYPTYQGQQQGYPPPPQQPWGGYPGEAPPLEQQQPERKSSKAWIGALAALIVLALIGVGVFVATSGSPEESTAGGAATTRTVSPAPTTTPRTTPRTSPAPVEPGQPGGGLGGAIQNFGATVGSISANDGSTLTIDGIDGKPVTVTTTPQTQVVSLGGTKVADLKVGDSVVVQGDKAGDGSITARIIISTSLPGGGGFGR